MIDMLIIFDFIVALSTFLMITSLVMLRVTLTRRIKKRVTETDEFYFNTGTIDFDLFNTALFAWACAAPGINKLKKYNDYLSESLNVREFASIIEIILAYICIISVSIVVGSGIFYLATDLLGLIDWP